MIMGDVFLSIAELQTITRRKKAKAMCKRLEDMKIPHMPDGDGWPLVLRSAVESKLTPAPFRPQDEIFPVARPDFGAAFGGRKRA